MKEAINKILKKLNKKRCSSKYIFIKGNDNNDRMYTFHRVYK